MGKEKKGEGKEKKRALAISRGFSILAIERYDRWQYVGLRVPS